MKNFKLYWKHILCTVIVVLSVLSVYYTFKPQGVVNTELFGGLYEVEEPDLFGSIRETE